MHPRLFSKNIRDAIEQELRAKVEGKCSGRYGYTVVITQVIDHGKGLLLDTGLANFTVSFRCLVFRPFKNEVLSAQVTSVAAVRTTSAAFEPTLHVLHIRQSLPLFQNGFFAQAGPCHIFVSKLVWFTCTFLSAVSLNSCPPAIASILDIAQLMPADYKYVATGASPSFVSEDETLRIEDGSHVRIKIVGIRFGADQIVSCALLQPLSVDASSLMWYALRLWCAVCHWHCAGRLSWSICRVERDESPTTLSRVDLPVALPACVMS